MEKEKSEKSGCHDWKKLTSSRSACNFLLFVPFFAIAAVFWLIISLNDDLQKEYVVRVQVVNVPDSVTFIADPPADIRVNVRDRGTKIASRFFTGTPVLAIDFNRYGSGGILKVSPAGLQSFLRGLFGGTAQFLSVSPDSIYADYTISAAKEVPVLVSADIVPEIGKTIGGEITALPATVKVFSRSAVSDTLQCVYTYPIVRRNVSSPLKLDVSIKPVAGCRIEPDHVTVEIPVEPLENRSSIVPVSALNVPVTESLMVFPRSVKVSYLVPLSTPDLSGEDFKVVVDYADVERYYGREIPLRLQTLPAHVVSASLEVDSVEYTVLHR